MVWFQRSDAAMGSRDGLQCASVVGWGPNKERSPSVITLCVQWYGGEDLPSRHQSRFKTNAGQLGQLGGWQCACHCVGGGVGG